MSTSKNGAAAYAVDIGSRDLTSYETIIKKARDLATQGVMQESESRGATYKLAILLMHGVKANKIDATKDAPIKTLIKNYLDAQYLARVDRDGKADRASESTFNQMASQYNTIALVASKNVDMPSFVSNVREYRDQYNVRAPVGKTIGMYAALYDVCVVLKNAINGKGEFNKPIENAATAKWSGDLKQTMTRVAKNEFSKATIEAKAKNKPRAKPQPSVKRAIAALKLAKTAAPRDMKDAIQKVLDAAQALLGKLASE